MVFQQYLYLALVKMTLVLSLMILTLLFVSVSTYSSPGAHGPNGEHIELSQDNNASRRPTFEAFSESFELVGEVFDDVLFVYLHDFQSNIAVQFADIELEVGGIAVNASFDESLNYYRAENADFLGLLNTPGEHEVTITILTEDNGDLLVANLMTPAISSQLDEQPHSHDDEHLHFPWWTVALVVACISLGFFVGRKYQGEKT
jgi:hypothetical protein